jgi:hypothetical protein
MENPPIQEPVDKVDKTVLIMTDEFEEKITSLLKRSVASLRRSQSPGKFPDGKAYREYMSREAGTQEELLCDIYNLITPLIYDQRK